MEESILDKVIAAKASEQAREMRIAELFEALMSRLNERERQVVQRRFGLGGVPAQTLKEVGAQFTITRERVRQIESNAVGKLREFVRHPELSALSEPVVRATLHFIEERGGMVAASELWEGVAGLNALPADDGVTRGMYEFLLEHLLEDHIDALEESRQNHAGWRLHFAPIDPWNETIAVACQLLEEENRPIPEAEFIPALSKRREGLELHVLQSHLHLSRLVRKNLLGQWGLSEWNTIVPRRVNDKIYLVLQYHREPLHFTEITKRINEATFDHKRAYPSTVHNELILDKKYVLVGRGIYALAEWGYTPGVVADVIIEALKAAGTPLSRETIVKEVLKHRIVRTSTILLALTDRNRFQRHDDGRYSLAA